MKNKILYIILAIAIGIILRTLQLLHHDLWFDEVFCYVVAKNTITNIALATIADNHPPLYEIVLHFWTMIFGASEVALRSLSLTFGILSLPLFYATAKQITNETIAKISLILFTLSPLLIYYSAENRMYSLFVFLTLGSVYYFLKLQKDNDLKTQILFVLFFTLALYTQYYAILLLIPFGTLAFKPYLRHAELARPEPYRRVSASKTKNVILLFMSLLLFSPWVWFYFSFSHPGSNTTNSFIALPATFASFVIGGTGIVTLRTYFFEASLFLKLFFTFVLVATGIIGFHGIKKAIQTSYGRTILIFLFTPLIALTLINFFITIFSIRSTLFLAPYFYILLSIGICVFKNKKTQLAYIIAFALIFIATNYIVLTNNSLKGPQIKESSKNISSNQTIYHTSILTYYSYKYYLPNSTNILLTHNPLSSETVKIIGGEKKEITKNNNNFVVVDIKNGSDQKEKKNLFNEIENNYVLDKKIKLPEIIVYEYRIKK